MCCHSQCQPEPEDTQDDPVQVLGPAAGDPGPWSAIYAGQRQGRGPEGLFYAIWTYLL